MTAQFAPADVDAIRHLLIDAAPRLWMTGCTDIFRLAKHARHVVEHADEHDNPMAERDAKHASTWLQGYEAIGGDALPEACADPECVPCQTPIRIRRMQARIDATLSPETVAIRERVRAQGSWR